MLFFPKCSRPSGFKSSLNAVHLKIFHVLEATTYLLDMATLDYSWRLASQKSRNLGGRNERELAGTAFSAGGEREIRTPGEVLAHSRFPGVRFKPLSHLSMTGLNLKTRLTVRNSFPSATPEDKPVCRKVFH